MHSDLIISQSDGRPMYLQIMEQIKQRVAVGDWERGQEIPSIRQLAVSLQVSVITVKQDHRSIIGESCFSLGGKMPDDQTVRLVVFSFGFN